MLAEKDQEICLLKDDSKKLLIQSKKSNDTKQCIQKLEQENQDLEKKLSKKMKKVLAEGTLIKGCLNNQNV
jgi:hypothetical protein